MKQSKINSYFFAIVTLLFLIAPNTTLFGVVVKKNEPTKISTAKKISKNSKLKQKIQRKFDRFKKKMDQTEDEDKKWGKALLFTLGALLLILALLLFYMVFAPTSSCVAAILAIFYCVLGIVSGVVGIVLIIKGFVNL